MPVGQGTSEYDMAAGEVTGEGLRTPPRLQRVRLERPEAAMPAGKDTGQSPVRPRGATVVRDTLAAANQEAGMLTPPRVAS